ncbi:MAG TPA: glycerophosphodiester phosphodiesterase [Clostridiales bacterium]|nr:glycerophosphodiester phosphodiesterase [Clostridiales bacterium]
MRFALGFLRLVGKLVLALVALVLIVAAVFAVRYRVWDPDPLDHLYAGADGVLVLGHRGAPEVAPENTIPSFLAALALGADGVELDVVMTADGELVVIHDFEVDRVTDGTGDVREMSLEEVKALDAGSWFSEAHAGTRIPTLGEVFDALPPDVPVNIEIKSVSLGTDGIEKVLAAFVAERDLYDRIVVSSFNPITLWRVKRADADIPTALLYAPDLPTYLAEGWGIPIVLPDALHPEKSMVDAAYVEETHRRGQRVNVWTVNDPAEMERLIELGVDGIITDRPDLLRDVLAETGGK